MQHTDDGPLGARVHNESNITGPYSGAYKRQSRSLSRDSDGLELRFCDRPVLAVTPSKPETFIVDHSIAGGRYVSSVYGNEFESGRIRYRIDAVPGSDDRFRITAIREVRRGRKDRGPRRHV